MKSPPENCKFSCDFENCSYKTNKKSNMEMHRQGVHLNKKFMCPECDKPLSSKVNLNSHLRNVHSKKLVGGVLQSISDPFSLPCKHCDYVTNRALHLERHMLSVHSEAALETVDQVYLASKQNQVKPALTELIRGNNPQLPQFGNLVRLEKVGDDGTGVSETDEMILGDSDDSMQLVTPGDMSADMLHLVTRRVSTDNNTVTATADQGSMDPQDQVT